MKTWLTVICLIVSFFVAGFAFLATFWVAYSKSAGSEFVFAFAHRILYAVPAGLLGAILVSIAIKLYPRHGIILTIPVSLAAGALFVPILTSVENAIQARENRIFHQGVAEQGEKNWEELQNLGFPKLTSASYEGDMFPPEGTSVVLNTDLSVQDAITEIRSEVLGWDEMRLGSKQYFGRLANTGELDRIGVWDSPTGTQILVQRISADRVLYETVEPFAGYIQSKMWDRAADILVPDYEERLGGAEGLKAMVESQLPPMQSSDVIQIGVNGPLDQWASYVVPSSLEGKKYLFIGLQKKSGLWRVIKLAATDWEGAQKLNRSLGREPET